MILFLTSSPCSNQVPEGVDLPCVLNRANYFTSKLHWHWKPNTQCLIISADPYAFERNDEMVETFAGMFLLRGLSLQDIAVCDARNEDDIRDLVEESDVIILAGGHVPTQNAFFARIGLRALLREFRGIVIGISAGTMNCADVVYAQPEEEGEALDPNYKRFIRGLGLTTINVLPHYQQVKDVILDGKHLFRDITCPDSMGRRFYALVDGSYILIEYGRVILYGEAYLVENGKIRQISKAGDRLEL